MKTVYYEERDGRWWLSDKGIEFNVATKEEITIEGYSSLIATALALAVLA